MLCFLILYNDISFVLHIAEFLYQLARSGSLCPTSNNSIARSGHRISHNLQQIQSSDRATIALSAGLNSRTFLGQKLMHIPHPLHHSLFTSSSSSCFFAILLPLIILAILLNEQCSPLLTLNAAYSHPSKKCTCCDS